MQQEIIDIWLDCDPGLDDTLAIVLAGKFPRIKLIGVSTSAGNTSLENTTKNALDVLFNIGRSDVPVFRGSEQLIAGKPHLAEYMHGSGGLGGVQIPSSDKSAIIENSFQAIRDRIMEQPRKLVWANTGAMTNLCLLFRQFPEIKQKISKIVIMGGAVGKGNITPAAEFNIFFDPQAFKETLQSKGEIPLIMIPLELTHEVKAEQHFFDFLKEREEKPFAKAILEMLTAYKETYYKTQNFNYPPVHDACVIYYILHPDAFELKKAKIVVDTGEVSYGRTNCYFRDPDNPVKQIDSNDWVGMKMSSRRRFWSYFENIFDNVLQSN